MNCQYIYQNGSRKSLRCKNITSNITCERHQSKRLNEVELYDFLDDVCNIDPSKMPLDLYDHCFKDLKKYVKYGDTVARENLMDTVCVHLTGLKWCQLDDNQSELDDYTLHEYQ